MEAWSSCLGFLVTLFSLCQLTNSELFTALVDLERVLYAEDELATSLQDYIAAEELRIERLKR